ncbi:hypothetical protein PAPHI01_1347 [Pancytospora philotis]|nr:hypothetical protein PAPHI01_1347 [Pancytospora philotis]
MLVFTRWSRVGPGRGIALAAWLFAALGEASTSHRGYGGSHLSTDDNLPGDIHGGSVTEKPAALLATAPGNIIGNGVSEKLATEEMTDREAGDLVATAVDAERGGEGSLNALVNEGVLSPADKRAVKANRRRGPDSRWQGYKNRTPELRQANHYKEHGVRHGLRKHRAVTPRREVIEDLKERAANGNPYAQKKLHKMMHEPGRGRSHNGRAHGRNGPEYHGTAYPDSAHSGSAHPGSSRSDPILNGGAHPHNGARNEHELAENALRAPAEGLEHGKKVARTALERGADPVTAHNSGVAAMQDYAVRTAAEDARRRGIISQELKDEAHRINLHNEHDRNHAIAHPMGKQLAQAAHAVDNERTAAENAFKNAETWGVGIDDPAHEALDAYKDAENLGLMKRWAETYLVTDRSFTKQDLQGKMSRGDPAAAQQLQELDEMEALATQTAQGNPKAAEKFGRLLAQNAEPAGMREMLSPADQQHLAAIGAQAATSAAKINRAKEALAEQERQLAADRAEAERIATARAEAEKAPKERAKQILREEQAKVDERRAEQAGLAAEEEALANGSSPEEAAAEGRRAEEAQRVYGQAIRNGATPNEASRAASRAGAHVPRASASDPREHQAQQRREAYQRTRDNALRDGKDPLTAENAGRQAYNETAEAQNQQNRAGARAQRAHGEKERAARRAREAQHEAELAEDEAKHAHEQQQHAKAHAEFPLKRARMHELAKHAADDSSSESPAKRKMSMDDYRRMLQEQERAREQFERAREAMRRHMEEEAKRMLPHIPAPPMGPEDLKRNRAKALEEEMARNSDALKADKAGTDTENDVRAAHGTPYQSKVLGDHARQQEFARLRKEREEKIPEHMKALERQNLSPSEAHAEAVHQAMAHGPGDLNGHDEAELMRNAEQEEERLERHLARKRSVEEALEGAKAIPDDQTSVPLNKAKMALPMKGLSNVEAENEEEEDQLETELKIRKLVSNTMVNKEVHSGLVTIELEDHTIYHVPERASALRVEDGAAYMDQQGYDQMRAEKKDTSPFERHIVDPAQSPLPGESIYYEAPLKNMQTRMNPDDPSNVFQNKNGTVDLSHAKLLRIEVGSVELQNAGAYANEERPELNEPVGSDSDEVSEEEREELRQQKMDEEISRKSTVSLLPDANGGGSVAEVTPPYGVRSRKRPQDLANGDEAPASNKPKPEDEPLDQAAKKSDEPSFIEQLQPAPNSNKIEQPTDHPLRTPDTEENKVYNILAFNAGLLSKDLGLDEQDYVDKLDALPWDVWHSFINFYRGLPGDPHDKQKLLKIDSQPFYDGFKNTFKGNEPSTIYNRFAPAAQMVTGAPNVLTDKVINVTPVTNISPNNDANAPTVKAVVGVQQLPSDGLHVNGGVEAAGFLGVAAPILDEIQKAAPKPPQVNYGDPFNSRDNHNPPKPLNGGGNHSGPKPQGSPNIHVGALTFELPNNFVPDAQSLGNPAAPIPNSHENRHDRLSDLLQAAINNHRQPTGAPAVPTTSTAPNHPGQPRVPGAGPNFGGIGTGVGPVVY